MDIDAVNPVDTLETIVEFAVRYQWVYDLQLTKYFVDKTWDKIPPDWKESLTSLTEHELNALPCGFFKESWPESLKGFIKTCQTLSLPRSPQPSHVTGNELDKNMRKGMSPKKIHEVSQMAAVVDKLCKECGVRHIVDIGSGLGYLGQVLSADYGYRVLGLESVDSHTRGAEKQVMKKELSNTDFRSVTFTLRDTDECFTEFHQMLRIELIDEECLKGDKSLAEEASQPQLEQDTSQTSHVLPPGHCDKPQGTPLCMMGLHCCGDLTPTMLRLLTWDPHIVCLVCVGCCYHNMSCSVIGHLLRVCNSLKSNDMCYMNSQEYKSFPMSSKIRSVMTCAQEKHPEWRLNTFALRLAAQETRARWQKQTAADHEYHVKNVAFRGIVELFCQTDHSALTKTTRRVARRKDYDTFDTYLAAVFDRTILTGNQDMEVVLNKLQHLYSSHTPDMVFIEPFTALQVALQPVLESLIVLDRLEFLHEHDIRATAVPIFNDEISPRNLALIGQKRPRNK